MKNYFLTLIAILLFSNPIISQQRNCGTMQHLEYLKSKDSNLEQKMLQNEENIKTWILNNTNRLSQNIITIPVVVHVVYYNNTENISDQQVFSQIDILNEDFRRLNSDTINTPAAFQSVAADTEIEFCLVTRDPRGVYNSMKARRSLAYPHYNLKVWTEWYKQIMGQFNNYKKNIPKKYSKHVLELKFEDFVRNHEKEEKKIYKV